MKIKITTIKDPDTSIPINGNLNKIDQIKNEIANGSEGKLCQVEVFDMWDELEQ